MGITNGDLFSHFIALSPGYSAPGEPQVLGQQRIGERRLKATHSTGRFWRGLEPPERQAGAAERGLQLGPRTGCWKEPLVAEPR